MTERPYVPRLLKVLRSAKYFSNEDRWGEDRECSTGLDAGSTAGVAPSDGQRLDEARHDCNT